MRKYSFDQESLERAFWERVNVGKPDKCWPWKLKLNKKGYGRFGWNYKVILAHRVAYQLTHGPIPDGLNVCHSCDNPACCNPAHLWLGTLADNNRDMFAKGRGVFPPVGINGGTFGVSRSLAGENHPQAKLTWTEVEEIRKLDQANMAHQKIAQRFGVSRRHVNSVVNGRVWKEK